MQITPRVVFGAIFAAATGMILFAIFYLQDYVGLDPCPMCVLSRYAFIVVAAVALVAAIHGPRGAMLKAYAVVVSIFALAGIGVSMRHSYLQHFPPAMESCGADLDFLVSNLPLSKALPKIFAGTGSCSKVDWKFLGLSIPEWALAWFALFAALAIWVAFFRTPTPRASP